MRLTFLLILLLTFFNQQVFSQTSNSINNSVDIEKSAIYHSKTDKLLSIHKISVFPTSDNVGGIYARPIEKALIELVQQTHRWDYQPSTLVGAIPYLEEFEESPKKVKQVTAGSELDAFIIARIIKGPNGISITLNLFLASDGKLLAQSQIKQFKSFEIKLIIPQIKKLYANLIQKIPYNGFVLSRSSSNRVTINLGFQDGVKKGDEISIIQILSMKRHPKFNFAISTEKEILGKVKIYKVDHTLSFASIISEKERGTILKGAKIYHNRPVTYDFYDPLSGVKTAQRTDNKKDNSLAFDKDASEWIPKRPPTFGKATLQLGLGTFNSKANLSTSGALEASTFFHPEISFAGEIWLTPDWIVSGHLKQGFASTKNPQTGTPDNVSHTTSHYSILVGYSFPLQGNFFGPKVQVLAGISKYSTNVDDSTPTGLTSASYGGLTLGLKGEMPVTNDKKWIAGINLNFLVSPSLTEKPVTSGAKSSASVSNFGLTVSKKLTPHMFITGGLDFTLTRASFTGTGTRSGETATTISQQSNVLSGGVTYLF